VWASQTGIPGRRVMRLVPILCVAVGLLGVQHSTASAANPPTTFKAFTGHGAGYSYAFSKPVRSVRGGILQFQFPGVLHIDSVRSPLYTLVSVFVLYVSDRSQRPSVNEQAGDITRNCLGRVFVSRPVPSGAVGFAYECRPNLSEWMCASDVERGALRVAVSVTAPKEGQCRPYERILRRAFFRIAGRVVPK
jgi:hypothetical protein